MIYFVTEKFIKDKTHITQNVDARDLAPYIPLAIKTYVHPILGYTFTNDLLTKFNAGTTNADEDELIEMIQYMGAFFAAYDAVPNITFKVSNKGVNSQFGDYVNSEGIPVVEYIRRNIMKFAKIYEQQLRAFLYENKDKYSLYSDDSNKEIQGPDKRDEVRNNITWL